MNDEQFLDHLKEKYPYLYKIEDEVKRVVSDTGFGNPSFSLRVVNGKVQFIDIISSSTFKFYKIEEIRK